MAGEALQERGQDQAQENPQPGEEQAEVVTDGGEDCVGGIAVAALEIAAPEMAIILHVPDDGFDRRTCMTSVSIVSWNRANIE